MKKTTLLMGLVLWGTIGDAPAADLKIDPDQRYLLLATKKTSTMQKELDQAAAAGFQVIVGSPTSGTEIALFLERTAEPTNPYKYLLLATTRTGTMQKELDQAAEENYRLLPKAIAAKQRAFGAVEIVLVLERPPDTTQAYRYKLLATTKTSTLQKEVSQARKDGYELAAMVSRGEHIVIMEKPVGD